MGRRSWGAGSLGAGRDQHSIDMRECGSVRKRALGLTLPAGERQNVRRPRLATHAAVSRAAFPREPGSWAAPHDLRLDQLRRSRAKRSIGKAPRPDKRTMPLPRNWNPHFSMTRRARALVTRLEHQTTATFSSPNA